MGNGMYCDDESYWCEQTDDEKLFLESRKALEYLKTAQRRLRMLMKRKAHYESNPLGSAMCRETEISISQQAMIIRRHLDELATMSYDYSHVDDETDTQKTTQEDWEQVMQLASMPIDMLRTSSQSHNSNTVASSSSSCYSMLRTTHYNSPMSGTTAHSEQKAMWQMSPPIEEVAELRQRLKELEQTPLFTDACPMHKLAKLTMIQHLPRSVQ
ncbi:hypothetical protein IWW41_002473 [Coemansia sp. RSA 2522]|nr:hypothetical protein IWW41_002473 [Coemansia sp. RSA 2522]